jgi:hypothetical protein
MTTSNIPHPKSSSKLTIAVNSLNTMIQQGNIMEAFETFYGEEVVIHENGNSPIKGKDNNRKRGIKFLWEIDEVYDAEILSVAIGDNISMTEWSIDIKPKDGPRKTIYRVNVQRWTEGKVTSERLYFCKD